MAITKNGYRNDFLDAVRSIIKEYMKEVYTCIPAHVQTFDPKTQLATIELGIERVDTDGSVWTPPPIIETPVLMIGDSFCVETQIDACCEGMAFFSQRCIDAWVQTGGVAQNPLRRFFDMQDAFFVAGFRPLSRSLPKFENNGIRLRNKAGNQFAWLKNDGSIEIGNGRGQFLMKPDGTVLINGVTITTDGIATGTDFKSGSISLKSHVHGGVSSGSSSTGAPK